MTLRSSALLERFAGTEGFEVVSRVGGREALAGLHRLKADVAMVDLQMPEVGGLDVLRAIRQSDPSCQVILMTGKPSIETAIEAIKLGAMDYVDKPLGVDRLRHLLTTVREDLERRRSVLATECDLAHQLEFCGMIGRSPNMQELFGLIRRLAPHVRTALITGETGTGKELVARRWLPWTTRIAKVPDRQLPAVVETLFRRAFGHVQAPSPAQPIPSRAYSSAQTAGRSSSTRLMSCHRLRRNSGW
jgi:DNA-binding NtrC family response regulator